MAVVDNATLLAAAAAIAADALTGWQGSLDRLAKPGSTDGDTDSGEPPRTHA